MPNELEKAPIRNGLRDLTVEEFWKFPLIVSQTLDTKLQKLPVNRKLFPELADQILDAMRLLRAVGMRRYGAISMLAVLDVLQAVDYFLVLRDEKQDSRDDGYGDDAQVLSNVFAKHKRELAAFRLWFNTHDE